jgi:hypothetical protein
MGWLMMSDLERIWKAIAVVAWFEVLSPHLRGEKLRKPSVSSASPASLQVGISTRTSLIRSTSASHLSVTSVLPVLPYIEFQEISSVFILMLGFQLSQSQRYTVLRRKAFGNPPKWWRVRIKVGLERNSNMWCSVRCYWTEMVGLVRWCTEGVWQLIKPFPQREARRLLRKGNWEWNREWFITKGLCGSW